MREGETWALSSGESEIRQSENATASCSTAEQSREVYTRKGAEMLPCADY